MNIFYPLSADVRPIEGNFLFITTSIASMKKTLRDLLAKGKTKQVIAELLTLTVGDTDLHHQAIQLSARYAQYEKQKLGDLEAPAVLNVELNRINQTALGIMEALEEEDRSMAKPTLVSKQQLIWLGTGLIALVGILANLATVLDFLGLKPKVEGKMDNVTVNVRDKAGALIESLNTQGYVIMTTSGGGVDKELIDDKGAASFKNIKVGDKVGLNIQFSEPYRPLRPDSVYTVPEDGRIQLTVALQHLGNVYGRVIYQDKELPGVIVAIGNLRDTTDDLGRYDIQIPESDQRPEQEVFFKKEGFKSMTKKAFPQTDQALNVVMER